jgi:3D (Asp-Asp-Asp) domain-containing protein
MKASENGRIRGRNRLISVLSSLARQAIVVFLLLLYVHAADGDPADPRNFLPLPSSPMEFEATAYCDSGITKSGIPVAPGIVAADPRVLPLGSLIKLETTEYTGVYRVLDTGGLVKGRIIDIYMPGLEEALNFGRRKVQIVVLRYGLPKPHGWTFTD